MNRRRFLQAGSIALAGLAGCMSGNDPAPATDSTTGSGSDTTTGRSTTTTPRDPTTARPTTTTAVPLSVSVTALQPGVIRRSSPDSTTVSAEAGSQYLFLSVSARGTAPPLESLSLRFDGDRHTPYGARLTRRLWRNRDEQAYGPETDSGWVLFALPERGDAGDAALTWPGGEWPVPGPVRSRLAAPLPTLSPTFSVDRRVGPDETPTIRIEVDNEGSVEGRFVAAIDRAGPSVAHIPAAQVREPVPAGETVTVTVEDEFYARTGAGDDEPDATYYLSWPGGSREVDVRLVDPVTTTAGA